MPVIKKKGFLILVCFIVCFALKIAGQTTKIDSLLRKIESSKHDTSYVKNLNLLSEQYLRAGQYVNAKNISRQAISSAKEVNYKYGLLQGYIKISKIYLSASNYDSSSLFIKQALAVCDTTKNKYEAATIYITYGNIALYKANYQNALFYYLKGLNKMQDINNQQGIAFCINNIGITYYYSKQFDKSLEYYFKALNFFKSINDSSSFGTCYENISMVYTQNNNYDSALFFVEKAIKMHEKYNNKVGLVNILIGAGDIYITKKNYVKVLDNFIRALNISKEIGDKRHIAFASLNIGYLYFQTGKIIEAELNVKTALQIATDIGEKDIIKNSYITLAQLYEKKCDYKQALKYQKLYTGIKDTLFNTESNKQIIEMNTKYETELKDKELLKKDSEIAIQQANSEKQAIIRNGFIIGFIFLLGLIVFIYRGYIQKQKTNKLLNDKNQKITDSINYAKLIQSSILPPAEDLKKYLPNSFVFYQPKDIVSGDFYWLYPINEHTIIFAVVDCTGHGVPGALMSMLGYSLLEQIINQNKITTPALILDQLNSLVIESLQQSGNSDTVKNGMDMAIFKLDYANYELEYAGAKNPLYVIRDQNLMELKADKKSIGLSTGNTNAFTNQYIKLHAGDYLYAFSDGYIDQKGGSENKKFYSSNFQKLLISINSLEAHEQEQQVKTAFANWKGNKDQIDDVLVFGIRV